MDEKLAKGLSNRFLREFKTKYELNEENLRKHLKFFYDDPDGRISVRDWIKLVDVLGSVPDTIVKLRTGRAKKTELYRINIEPADLNPLKDWDELSIIGVLSKLSLRSNEFIEGNILFSLSQHCIKRIFERKSRSNNDDFGATFDHSIVLQELSYVGIFASLMRKFATDLDSYMNTDQNHVLDGSKFKTNLPILIPSESGILMGEFQDEVLLIRTFLHEDQISEVQETMRSSLANILAPISGSPLAMHPYILHSFRHIERVTLDFMISLYLNLIVSIYIEHLNYIFRGDEKQKQLLKGAIHDFVNSDRFYKFQGGVSEELTSRSFEENLVDLSKIMRNHLREISRH